MRSTNAESRPPARTASPLDVEVGFAGVRHDPFLSALDLTAHKLVEHKVRQFRVVESHAPQGPGRRVQRRVPELFRIHLTEALVARDGGLTSALAVIGAFVGVGGRGFGLLHSLLGRAAARAVMSALISSLPSILSARAFSTLRILPRSGRIAWVRRSRPPFALPPADGPSTMKSSHFSGSRSEQSASFPGREKPSSAPLRCTRSRAFRAASRARNAVRHFSTMRFASAGFSSRY